jgi:predicted PurR-regulated permease PerM
VAAVALIAISVLSTQINAMLAAVPRYVVRGEVVIAGLFEGLGESAASGLVTAFRNIDVAAFVRALAGLLRNLTTTAVLVVLYVGYLFGERARFPKKLEGLQPDPERARQIHGILASIVRSVRHYIMVKTIISLVTGLLIYLVMLGVGLELAGAWAVLTVALNFIPSIGSIVATVLVVAVAMLQFDDWVPVLVLLGAAGGIQITIGNLIEPILLGRSLRLSSFAIILSLTFWGSVWGIVGMFLAVPIMVSVMIICSHVSRLHPVAILLSREGTPIPVAEGATIGPRHGSSLAGA